MRLHRLGITAFGPFADAVDLDLDQVSSAGLFLLSGATGAGKTSILDAVCFALYGDVPGDRATAKRLRCDQAPPSVRPRVELDCTLSGRRFRIVRTPSWERPKKRGSGMTTEQASVSVSEWVAGDWSPLTTRLDEAGDLIAGLLGMNLGQFTQVALLPQGQPERQHRALAMVKQMRDELFGHCSNAGECEASCPKGIKLTNISFMNREYLQAAWHARDWKPEEEPAL